jgi:hypothetical protein
VLTLQNQVNLSNLTNSLNAGALKARAWSTLRAAVANVTPTRAAGSVTDASAVIAAAYQGGVAGQALPVMRRGSERC